MVLALFCELYPSKRYDLVWTFSAPGAAFAQSDILVPVSRHQTFGFLVDRVSKEIVDPFSFYGKAPDQLGKVTSFVPKCMDCDADGSVTWYTCGDLPKLCEFFESYYTSQGLGRTKGAGSKSGNTLGPQSKSANALRDDDGGSDSDSDDRTGDGDQSEDDDRIDDNGQNEDHDEEESDGDTVEDDDEGAGDDADNGISVQTVPVPIPRQASQQTPGQPKSAAVAAATTSKPLSHRIAVEVGSGLVLLLAFFVYFYASGWAGR
ncbi:uncharacterized protein BJ171DRAFT_212916 [Polychytrium aggregatum]|uniref:uncharacterized protein n=1 Tax=Polychytrium aggregatum TaxID=110093 RepID=UPI0022FE0C4F|nr:uncharacterized protein BJ171DRAFT_212916 [Polychytrium aggregatum]KAI9208746.1 hypothetical protein BJ171DRAFT_212916 [Polychytrium aggregatum]